MFNFQKVLRRCMVQRYECAEGWEWGGQISRKKRYLTVRPILVWPRTTMTNFVTYLMYIYNLITNYNYAE